MKVRFHNNSVRIRLGQTEVTSLAAGIIVRQSTCFSPSSQLSTSIEPVNSNTEISVRFDASQLIIFVSAIRVIQWAKSDEVGFEATLLIDQANALRILIEKDFYCLHGGVPDNEDSFPNPLAD